MDGFVATQNDYLQASVPPLGAWPGISSSCMEWEPNRRRRSKLGRMETGNFSQPWHGQVLSNLRSRSADAKKELEDAQTKAQKAVADNADLKPTWRSSKSSWKRWRAKSETEAAENEPVSRHNQRQRPPDRAGRTAHPLDGVRASESASGEAGITLGAGHRGGGWWLKGNAPGVEEELRPFLALPLLYGQLDGIRSMPSFAAAASNATDASQFTRGGQRFAEVVKELGIPKLRAALTSDIFARLQAQILAKFPPPSGLAEAIATPSAVAPVGVGSPAIRRWGSGSVRRKAAPRPPSVSGETTPRVSARALRKGCRQAKS